MIPITEESSSRHAAGTEVKSVSVSLNSVDHSRSVNKMLLNVLRRGTILFLGFLVVVNCDWIKVPVQTHEPNYATVHRDLPPGIADKLDSLAVTLKNVDRDSFHYDHLDNNGTKQLDLNLDQKGATTEKTPPREEEKKPSLKSGKPNNPEAVTKGPVVDTKRRVAEPFSIFNFLRSVRDSFFFKPQSSVKQKVGFLERMRDSILSEISE